MRNHTPPRNPMSRFAAINSTDLAKAAHAHSDRIIQLDRYLVARDGLRAFIPQAWAILEGPSKPFVGGWHIDAICEHLMAVSKGDIKRLAISMPPRHMKSLSVSVFWLAWDWLNSPWRQFLYAARISFLITAIYGGGVISYHYYQRALSAKDLEKERALKLAALAQISSLESRIHPHFLFNTLNSISALIPEDPRRAEQLIERVSALLRFSLDSANKGLVTLEEEMKIVSDYLEIEKTRFDARLTYQVHTDPECLACLIPPLSVQTLVENSVKHAIATSRSGGSIEVAATIDSGRLRIEVFDSGPGFSSASIAEGHGLDMLRSRLTVQFESRASLHIDGSRVTLWIPA